MGKIKIKCKKDLISQDGSKSFTKDKIYEVINDTTSIEERTKVYDNQNYEHRLGHWYNNFKIVK